MKQPQKPARRRPKGTDADKSSAVGVTLSTATEYPPTHLLQKASMSMIPHHPSWPLTHLRIGWLLVSCGNILLLILHRVPNGPLLHVMEYPRTRSSPAVTLGHSTLFWLHSTWVHPFRYNSHTPFFHLGPRFSPPGLNPLPSLSTTGTHTVRPAKFSSRSSVPAALRR